MLFQLHSEDKNVKQVSKSYKPKVILGKCDSLTEYIKIIREGAASNVPKAIEQLQKLYDPRASLILFTRKKIMCMQFVEGKDAFAPFVFFCPKYNKVLVYYIATSKLAEHFIKDNFDYVSLRFCLIGGVKKKSKEDDKLHKRLISEMEVGKKKKEVKEKVEMKVEELGEKLKKRAEKKKKKKDVGDGKGNEEKSNAKFDDEAKSPSNTGFTSFLNQFISGKKKVAPSDRLMISHEKEIKLLKKELEEEKEYSLQMFNMVLKLQKNIDEVDVKKMSEVNKSLLSEIDEIKKLNKFQSFDELSSCCICMTRKKDTLLLPCKHLCLCGVCSVGVMNKFKKCPICQNEIERKIDGIKYIQ